MISPTTIADMHIHSCASDSSDTPAQIIDKLKSKDIRIASLTDHNSVANVAEFLNSAEQNDIYAISGVEISSKIGDTIYHILAYGFDPDDRRVAEFVDPILAMMKGINRQLIIKMSDDYSNINVDEYDEYLYDRTRGGWASVNYIYDKGLVKAPIDALALYRKYDCTLVSCDYPSPEEVFNHVLSWDAFPILAHPIYYFNETHLAVESITSLYDLLKSQGLAGIECYYPSHNEAMTGISLEWCKSNNMMITAGCDSHGSFVPGRGIGTLRIPLSKLNINQLIVG